MFLSSFPAFLYCFSPIFSISSLFHSYFPLSSPLIFLISPQFLFIFLLLNLFPNISFYFLLSYHFSLPFFSNPFLFSFFFDIVNVSISSFLFCYFSFYFMVITLVIIEVFATVFFSFFNILFFSISSVFVFFFIFLFLLSLFLSAAFFTLL
ncbi:unnamed protein product [Acanthosepion pharaonis]|uniref:Uncharacterized protein n=1 Tax=Acanthosepion pharaonis TaxID=158019 RepID=A0A812B7C5_ACAPH|nr:unnamed protein product [Sepia pharaonis]